MATKQEIQNHIAQKLRRSYEQGVDGNYVKSAMAGNISQSDWESIANWLFARQFDKIGRLVGNKVVAQITADADTEAATMLANDSVDLAEYARIEGL